MTLRDTTTFDPWLDNLETQVAAFNQLHAQLAAADGDKDKAIDAFMATSQDEQAVKARALQEDLMSQLATIQAQFKQYAAQNVQVAVLDKAEREKLESQYKAVRKEVKDILFSLNLLTKTAGPDAVKAWEEYLAEHPDPTSKRLPSATDSLPKLSCTVTASTGAGSFTFATLGETAKWLDLPVQDVHKAVASAVVPAIKPEDLAKIKESVSLDITARNGVVAHLTVTPKARKPRSDSKAAQAAAASQQVQPQTDTPPADDVAADEQPHASEAALNAALGVDGTDDSA